MCINVGRGSFTLSVWGESVCFDRVHTHTHSGLRARRRTSLCHTPLALIAGRRKFVARYHALKAYYSAPTLLNSPS